MDAGIVQAARRGHRPARLLRELQDPRFRLCLELLDDGELPRDATQETAARFLRRLASFRGDSQHLAGPALNVAAAPPAARRQCERPSRPRARAKVAGL